MKVTESAMDSSIFELPPEGLNEEQRNKALDALNSFMKRQKKNFLGYQVNDKMDYENDLKQYLNMHINNVGDPFTSGNLTTNSKIMECAVLDYYAKLWNAKTPHDPADKESYWGYSLSMGSTEGNVYAIWNARDYLGGKVLLVDEAAAEETARVASLDGEMARISEGILFNQAVTPKDDPNKFTPIAFYSQDTHYSIVKAMRVMSFTTFYALGSEKYECPLKFPEDYPEGFSKEYIGKNDWPLEVPSNRDGSIHIAALAKLVEFFVSKGYPIFTCFNYGTTFKGAYDDVKAAVDTLVPILKKYGMYEREIEYDDNGVTKRDIRSGYWFHVDGALGAAYMPFIEKAYKENRLPVDNFNFHIFDFRIPEVHSIVMSGHKWIGAPFPCGIFMTKVKYQLMPPDDPMYIGSPDTTFAGSRNGLSAMILWDYVAKHSYASQVDKAVRTESLAVYAVTKLKQLEEKLGKDLWVERSPLSLTIRFKQPNKNLVFKYSLSCEELYVNGKKRAYAHIFAMEHVTEDLIDSLIEDLSKPGAFPEQTHRVLTRKAITVHKVVRNSVYLNMMGRGFK